MVASTVDAVHAERRMFYVWMASAFILIAFGGFIPTYWAKLASGTFPGNPITHIHGALFFTWTLFYFSQTALVASGRVVNHRNWGLVGISLASVMCCTVVLAEINSVKVAEHINMGDQARRFVIVSFSGLVTFATLFTLAIVNTRHSEVHKRLMILAMIPLMQAAFARIFKTLVAPDAVGPPPVFVSVPPGLIVDLLVVVAMFYDWRTRGRPHTVYLVGLPALILTQVLPIPISTTSAWMSVAKVIEALAG